MHFEKLTILIIFQFFSYFDLKFQVATNVKIGDPLTLEIALDKELGKHGLRVTDCIVKDGLGWAQQNLINNGG